MSEAREEGGDPKENTAIVERPQRPSSGKGLKITLSLLLGIGLVVLAVVATTCVSKQRGTGKNVWERLAQAEVNVAALQGQMATTMARTGVVEARVDKLDVDANTDRLSAAGLLSRIEGVEKNKASTVYVDNVAKKKVDRSELKKYARVVERIETMEREVADMKVAPPPDDPGAGTVTVRVRTVPVSPDEE